MLPAILGVDPADLEVALQLDGLVIQARCDEGDETVFTFPVMATSLNEPAGILTPDNETAILEPLMELVSAHLQRFSLSANISTQCTHGEGVACTCATLLDETRTNLVRGNLAHLLKKGIMVPDLREVAIHSVSMEVTVAGTDVQLGLALWGVPEAGKLPAPLLPATGKMMCRGATLAPHENNALYMVSSCAGSKLPHTVVCSRDADVQIQLKTPVVKRRAKSAAWRVCDMTRMENHRYTLVPTEMIDFTRTKKSMKDSSRFIFDIDHAFWKIVFDPAYNKDFSRSMSFSDCPKCPVDPREFKKQVILTYEAVQKLEGIIEDHSRLMPFVDVTNGIRLLLLPNTPTRDDAPYRKLEGTVETVVTIKLVVPGVRLARHIETAMRASGGGGGGGGSGASMGGGGGGGGGSMGGGGGSMAGGPPPADDVSGGDDASYRLQFNSGLFVDPVSLNVRDGVKWTDIRDALYANNKDFLTKNHILNKYWINIYMKSNLAPIALDKMVLQAWQGREFSVNFKRPADS